MCGINRPDAGDRDPHAGIPGIMRTDKRGFEVSRDADQNSQRVSSNSAILRHYTCSKNFVHITNCASTRIRNIAEVSPNNRWHIGCTGLAHEHRPSHASSLPHGRRIRNPRIQSYSQLRRRRTLRDAVTNQAGSGQHSDKHRRRLRTRLRSRALSVLRDCTWISQGDDLPAWPGRAAGIDESIRRGRIGCCRRPCRGSVERFAQVNFVNSRLKTQDSRLKTQDPGPSSDDP